MSFFKSIFRKKEQPIHSNADFWQWFLQHEKTFYKVIKERDNIEQEFLDKLSPKLKELKDGFWFLAGMYNDDTAELILTADGVIKNIVFVEELVDSAPKMDRWKITALKQPTDLNRYRIEMNGYKFDENTMSFYANEHEQMPDEIDITITHKDFNEENKDTITNGVFLALDSFLGELNSVTSIDNVNIINPKDATAALIPLEKLKDFLIWREKEFVEKYKGFRYHTDNDNYSALEATLNNGLPLFAMINTDLLHWDSKASHPWIVVIKIDYDGNNNGMPDKPTYELLNDIEDKIMIDLKDADGYLNIGRQTADSVREIYFACTEFRKPSKVLYKLKKDYHNRIALDYDIYKDKYWQTFNRFMTD
ncbi:MAG: DUF695 domain-containing protein [Flavobacteriia bacterium]|nr:MAG: DUF695 domain-containing protein [Flavobacteriia bacterium]